MSDTGAKRPATQRVAAVIFGRPEAWRAQELAQAAGCALATVRYCLHHLERCGAVRRVDRVLWIAADPEAAAVVITDGGVAIAGASRSMPASRSLHRELRSLDPLEDDLGLTEQRWRAAMGEQRFTDIAAIKRMPIKRYWSIEERSPVGCAAALCCETRAAS
jgi:hypothetical protein